MALLAAVEAGHIIEVIWVSLLAGLGVTTAFSLVVLGAARSEAARRGGRGVASVTYGALAVIAFVAFAAVVVFGVQIMLSK